MAVLFYFIFVSSLYRKTGYLGLLSSENDVSEGKMQDFYSTVWLV